METKTLAPKQAYLAMKSCPVVTGFRLWEGKTETRVYLVLEGASDRHRGDGSTQVYLETKSARLVIFRGKGTRSSDFRASLEAVAEFARENGIEVVEKSA